MRIAAISDIHGNSAALDAVLDDIRRRGADLVVNLGDCFSGPLDARGTAERLAALDLPAVRGNHDRMLWDAPGLWERWTEGDLDRDTIDWCRALPLTLQIDGVLFCHATPESDDENWLDHRGPGQRLIARDLAGVEQRAAGVTQELTFCGHTHQPRAVRLPDGRRIVNPGAVGVPAYLDTRGERPFVQQTGAPDARYAIAERRGRDWHVDLIAVPYDTRGMVALAREKDAGSWAEALKTGWTA
jgi:putative phosphoesterase